MARELRQTIKGKVQWANEWAGRLSGPFNFIAYRRSILGFETYVEESTTVVVNGTSATNTA
jgi:hypothetical protein